MPHQAVKKIYLLACDFDQTLSFNDSGLELAKLLGVSSYPEKVAGLARQNFVSSGAELSYLVRHDPEFRKLRREHLAEAGKRVRLKHNVEHLAPLLNSCSDEHQFALYVVSAAPQEVVQSALEGIIDADHIFGTRFRYADSGEIQAIEHCTAGYGKVAVIEDLRAELELGRGRVIYVGDGGSDIHVMLHVNFLKGMTIAVSENRLLEQIATRSVFSHDVLGVAIPILEEIVGLGGQKIQERFEARGFVIQEWGKLQADSLTIRSTEEPPPEQEQEQDADDGA